MSRTSGEQGSSLSSGKRLKSFAAKEKANIKVKKMIKALKTVEEAPEEDPDPREYDFTTAEKTQMRRLVKEMTVPGKGVIDICDDVKELQTAKKLPQPRTKLCATKFDCTEDVRQRIYGLYLHATKQHNLWFYASGLLMQEEMVNFFAAKKNIRALADFHIKCGVKVGEGARTLPGSLDEPADQELDKLTDANILRYKDLGIAFLQREIHFRITKATPSVQGLQSSSEAGARFCRRAQGQGMVPLLSLEVAVEAHVDGEVQARAYEEIFAFLSRSLQLHRVYIEGIILHLKAIPYLNTTTNDVEKCRETNADINDNCKEKSTASPKSPEEAKKKCCEKNDSHCVHLPLETRSPLKGLALMQMYQVEMKKNESKLRRLYSDFRSRISPRDPRAPTCARRAAATARLMSRSLPAFLGGVMLATDSSLHTSVSLLTAMNRCPAHRWPLHVSFCFRGVVQQGVIDKWAGRDERLGVATEMLVQRAKACSLATMGQGEELRGSLWVHDALAEPTRWDAMEPTRLPMMH